MERFRTKNKQLNVWHPGDLFKKIEAEVKIFAGDAQREQFINFWNWFFYAKEENKLLKPETGKCAHLSQGEARRS